MVESHGCALCSCLRVRAMGERLTQGDIDKIQAEIDERKLVIRPKLLEEVAHPYSNITHLMTYFVLTSLHVRGGMPAIEFAWIG